ncbi:hypothetical protein [Xanthocytophaga flava]|uniref:hypothetical protein n=1 Tax=Xanthocytophaga flava TaxID=3048013 RepID=UPI0028D24B46|nr:hypothetical protein [Xanthocytophaga flavus]MDJ1468153.1 hypothetical protein [Xanthocytophaga flavus]
MIELRIEGTTVPFSLNTSIALDISSSVFDLEVVKGTKSYPFTLPVSKETDLIFGGINNLQSAGSLRKTFKAELFAHGSLILKGKFKLNKPTNNSYPGYLVSAAGSLQQEVGKKSLRSLDLGSTSFDKFYEESRFYFLQLPEANTWTVNTKVDLFVSVVDGYYGSYYSMFDGSVESTLTGLAAQLNADLINTGGHISYVKGNTISVSIAGSKQFNILGSGISTADINTPTLTTIYSFYPAEHKHVNIRNTEDIVFPVVSNTAFYEDDANFNGFINEIVPIGSSLDSVLTTLYGVGPHYQQNSSDDLTRYSAVAMPFLHKVLNSIFALAGFTPSGLLLSDSQLQKLIVYNNYALDMQATYSVFGLRGAIPGKDFCHFKDIVNHAQQLPDITVGEFLNAIRIPFNFGFFFNLRSGKVELIPLKDILSAPCELDWTDRVVPTWSQEAEDEKTYTFSFTEDSSDSAFKDSDTTVTAQLASYTLASSDSDQEDIQTEGIESKVSPLPVKTIGSRLVPYALQKATTVLFGGVKTDAQPRLLFWYGMSNDTQGKLYPKASNVSPDGNYSLQWNGEKGLYNTFWKDWIAFQKRSRRLEIPVTLRPEDLTSLDLKKKVHIRGNDYLIENLKISVPLKIGSPGTLTAWRV